MKYLLLFFALALAPIQVSGQIEKEYRDQAMEKARKGDFEGAILLFDRSLEENANDTISLHLRGISKALLNRLEEALKDMDRLLVLNPGSKKTLLTRARIKRDLTDYPGALEDYTRAIALDSAYAPAYFNRGILHEMLGNEEAACTDYQMSSDLGIKEAEGKLEACEGTAPTTMGETAILYLTEVAGSEAYGFTQEEPVLVGVGPEGGPANQQRYLRLLRDPQGNPITFKRLGSCCEYPSENGFFGSAMLDQYEINYSDQEGNPQSRIVYMSFYDYESPLILKGFQSISGN